jgi:hypothetical protein
MAYIINRFDGQAVATIEDGTIDQSLDVKLIGKNYAGYGEIQNENFLHMLENFSSSSPPARAIRGQIWYDVTAKKLKFFTGQLTSTGAKLFKTAGGVEYSATAPLDATEGDQWFDSGTSQLKVRNSSDWVVIGPQTAGSGTTQLVSEQVRDTQGILQPIIRAVVGDQSVYIISRNEFTIDPAFNNVAGFSGPGQKIKRGITMPNTLDFNPADYTGQVTSTSFRFWGISAAAHGVVDSLGNYISGSRIAQLAEGTNTGLVSFASDDGILLGLGQDLAIYIDPNDGQTPIIENKTGSKILFRARQSGVPREIAVIDAATLSLSPGTDNAFTLGLGSKKWSNVYATTFTGTATQAATLQVGTDLSGAGVFRIASTSGAANTIACRDTSGNLTANIFNGTATTARYADLAEKYLADKEYEVGTVVSVGGTAEVTASNAGDRAIGVVSANPAYMMNSELEGGTYVALKGRVPCSVIGAVRKGQRLVAADNGFATAAEPQQQSDVFGIALESSDNVGVKKIEVLVL